MEGVWLRWEVRALLDDGRRDGGVAVDPVAVHELESVPPPPEEGLRCLLNVCADIRDAGSLSTHHWFTHTPHIHTHTRTSNTDAAGHALQEVVDGLAYWQDV